MDIKLYCKNLWLALTGKPSFRQEIMEDIQRRKKVECIMQCIDELLKDAERNIAENKVKGYQKLIENLRKRIADKDRELDEQSRRYSDAIITLRKQHKTERDGWQVREQELREEVDDVQEILQRNRKDIGREMEAKNGLGKINAALNDLYQAMVSEEVEKMAAVEDYLDWCPILSQIAQHHMKMLRRIENLRQE